MRWTLRNLKPSTNGSRGLSNCTPKASPWGWNVCVPWQIALGCDFISGVAFLLLTLVGRVMDPDLVQRAIIAQVGSLIGGAGADQVRTIVEHSHQASGISVGTMLSLLALALGATAAFAQLQASLNKVWGVKPNPNRNQVRVFLMKRVFS